MAIGLVMPQVAVEIGPERLAPAHFIRAVTLAEVFPPDGAVAAGFLDRVVPAAELPEAAATMAAGLAKLDISAHAATKQRAREQLLAMIRSAIEADDVAILASA